jgi:hypothetical protein
MSLNKIHIKQGYVLSAHETRGLQEMKNAFPLEQCFSIGWVNVQYDFIEWNYHKKWESTLHAEGENSCLTKLSSS